MFQKTISVISAIVLGYIGLKIVTFLFSMLFGIAVGIFKIVVLLAIAIPIYFLINNKLSKKNTDYDF
ncbi:MAG: hypothetical protein GX372_00920 [Ignavibacteria bacterium]|jgi:hypothetical protein|nr:hypothetical protein [Ignavibacteria bacterium]